MRLECRQTDWTRREDALAQKLEHSGKHAEELSGEMQSMKPGCIRSVS